MQPVLFVTHTSRNYIVLHLVLKLIWTQYKLRPFVVPVAWVSTLLFACHSIEEQLACGTLMWRRPVYI